VIVNAAQNWALGAGQAQTCPAQIRSPGRRIRLIRNGEAVPAIGWRVDVVALEGRPEQAGPAVGSGQRIQEVETYVQ
jgi:hypothetical protein